MKPILRHLMLALALAVAACASPVSAQQQRAIRTVSTGQLRNRVVKNITEGWSLTNPTEAAKTGTYFYQRTLTFQPDELKGRRIYLFFDGVNQVADVLVNHRQAGQHVGAQTAFGVELTKWLHPGDNLIEVWATNGFRTDALPLGGNPSLPAGIYKPVWLITTASNCIPADYYGTRGIFIRQRNVSKDDAELQVEVKVSRAGDGLPLSLRLSIFDAERKLVCQASNSLSQDARAGLFAVAVTVHIPKPHLWQGSKDPYKYLAFAQLVDGDGNEVDDSGCRFGIRTITLDDRRQVLVNGIPYNETDTFTLTQLPLVAPRGGFVTGYLPSVDDNAKQMLRELIYQRFNWPECIYWGLADRLEASDENSYGSPIPLVTELNQLAHELDKSRVTSVIVEGDRTPWTGAADIVCTPQTAPFDLSVAQ